jgi:O-methyltransferase
MSRAIKAVFRPLSRSFFRLPGIRRLISRGATTISTETNTFVDFIEGGFGAAYGLTSRNRTRLVERFQRNGRCIESATEPQIHAVLAMELLSIPPAQSGDVIECGSFKGASAASLSLVCRITGRRLFVCDSFEGLPDAAEAEEITAHGVRRRVYRKGMYCGKMEEVRENIRKYGDIGVCEFVPGVFSTSLDALSMPVVFAFLDVNLVDSMKDCLRHIWPLMVEGGVIYSNDATDSGIVRLCFDEDWWQETFRQPAPGFVGSGCGLPLGPEGSSLGYIRRSDRAGRNISSKCNSRPANQLHLSSNAFSLEWNLAPGPHRLFQGAARFWQRRPGWNGPPKMRPTWRGSWG